MQMMRVVKKFGAWKYKHLFFGSLFLFFGVISFLTLISFCPTDLSWAYHSSDVGPISNLLGTFGAQIAALFFYLFGFCAIGFSFFFFYCTYLFLFRVPMRKEWDRFVACLFLPVVSSALFYWYQFDFFAVSPGGAVGSFLYQTLAGWFDPIGGALLVHLFFVTCLMVIFRATFVRLLHLFSHVVQFLFNKEKFLRPVYVASKKIGRAVAVPFVWATKFVRRLFDGKDITASGQSVVSFEQKLVDEVEFCDVHEDPFWKDFTGKSVASAAQKISSPDF